MIMKIVNVNAYSVSDVKNQVPFTLVKNATTMWKKAGSPMEGEALKTFMKEYLTSKTKQEAGYGCYIVLDNAVSDSRENPYKITNIPTDGKRKFKRKYQLVTVDNTILGQADSKEEAIKLAKQIVLKEKENLGVNVPHSCKVVYEEISGQDTAFNFSYNPSQNAKVGTFLCFGIETETV